MNRHEAEKLLITGLKREKPKRQKIKKVGATDFSRNQGL